MNRSWPVKGILPISLVAIWSCTDSATLLTPEAKPQASHLVPDCFGRNATIYIGSPGAGTITPDGSGGYTITGTAGNDVIVGGPGNDIINAGDGGDRICAGGGDDVLSGGNGTNYMDGELGVDAVDYSAATAGVGVNLLTGKARSTAIIDGEILNVENIRGSAFDDQLRGNAANNVIRGGEGNDILYGLEAVDTLFGQAGNDELHGGDGDDVLSGGTEDDLIIPGLGADWIVGQSGFDVVSYKGSVAVEVDLTANVGANGDAAGDTWRGIEGIIGTNGNDVLTGDDSKNVIDGEGGDDVITGGADRDRLNGGLGNDEIHGGDEADHIFGHEGDDELYGDEGDDVFSSGPGANLVDGGNGIDRFVSSNCLDTVTSIEIMQSGRCTEDLTTSTVTPAAASIVADGASTTTITVALKDAGGNAFTVGGATVVLTTDAGTLTNGGTPAASVTATDQNDGTYTAALIASTSLETATVTATVNGDALTDDAVVTFTFGPLDHFLVEAAGGGAIGTQVKDAAFNIQVTAQDANNHTVADFTGTVALDYEGDVSGSITATSGAFIGGVLSSESVTIPATGASVQIRATDGASNTGVSAAFAVDPSDEAPQVTSTTPLDAATGVGPGDDIDIVFSENVTVTAASFELECPTPTDHAFTLSGSNASYTLTPDTPLPGATVCTVTVVAANVSDTDTDDAPDNMAADYVFSFTTGALAVADTYTETVHGNVSVNSANAATSYSVLDNDETDGGTTATDAGWSGTPGVTENGGTVSITAAGTFTYNPPAGFEGTDRFTYTITGGSTADVTLTVSGMLWFVNNGGAACTTVTSGCGRLSNPYSTLAAFNAENTGVGNRPAAGDGIFLYESGSAYPGAITLLNNQELIGQDATSSLATLGYTPPPSGAALPAMNSGNGTFVTISGADGINLGQDNALHGLTVATTAGEAIGGTAFGTLTLTAGAPDVTIASSGQALSLTTGTITGTFASVGSTGGTRNVNLDGVSAAALSLGTGTLSGSSGGAIRIAGGNPLNLTVAGAVTQAANAALLDVSGSHTGTLNFTNTSNLQASNGTGLQFNAAGGTYTFSGTTNLAGGDAGVDITNGSAGSFTFGTGTTITNPTGVGFRLYGSTAGVTYSGSMSKSSAGDIVEIGEHSGGTATFNTGTISATSGSGVSFSNADGTYNFSGTTTLNGGDAHITVTSGSAGAITFGAGASVTNPSTTSALSISNGVSSTNVTYNGTITTNAARPVFVEGVSGGTVTVGGNINTTAGLGMLIQNNTGGTITFSGATKAIATAANPGITLTNNTGAAITFPNGGLGITTSTGRGFRASGGGTLSVSGPNNTVAINGAESALWLTGMTVGNDDIAFNTITSTGTATGSPVCLETLTGSVTQTVTLTSVSIAGTSGLAPGICVTSSSAPVTIASATVDNTGAAGIQLTSNTAAVAVNAGSFGATNDPTGNVVDVDGGNAGVTIAANLTKSTAGRIAEVTGHTAGTVTFSGSLNCTSGCTGINVSNNTGGSIDFTSSTKTLNTGANAAVTLATNTGATVNFTGNNLDIDVTTGTGFNATGGGTVSVTGTNNTVTAVGGTGINIQNTTIGASDVIFQSVSTTGGTNGIVLNNTGSTGNLSITGTGSGTTGGTIASATGDGVSLTSTSGVSLQYLRVMNSGGTGIYGSSVTGFTLLNGTIQSNGNAVLEAGIEFDGLFGSAFITNSTITGSADDNIVVRNLSGTLDSLVVTGSTINTNSGIGNDGILLTAGNNAVATLRVRNNTFSAHRGDHVNATANNTANVNVVLFQNTMSGGHATPLGQGITLGTGLTHSGTFTYDINDNDIPNGPISNAITISHAGTTGSLFQGRIRNNVIGTSGLALSCSTQASGIVVDVGNRGTHTVAVTGNTVKQCLDRGIFFDAGDGGVSGSATVFNITATGNTVNELVNALSRDAMRIELGAFDPNFLGATDNFVGCAAVGGALAADKNTLAGGVGGNAIRARLRFNTRLNMPGYAGTFNNAASEVEAYFTGRNTLGAGGASATTTAVSGSFGYGSAAFCPTPP